MTANYTNVRSHNLLVRVNLPVLWPVIYQLFFSHSVNCSDPISVKIDHGSDNCPPKENKVRPYSENLLSFTWLWFHVYISIYHRLLKKSDQKVEFQSFLKMVTFQQFWPFWKNALLWMAVAPNRLAYSKVCGVSGKIISISFIWYLVVLCVTTSLVTRTSWKVGLKW